MKHNKFLKTIAIALIFSLTVTLFAPAVFAEETTPSIPDLSGYSFIYIDEITDGTTVNTLISNTTLSETESISFYDSGGYLLSGSDLVGNGTTIVITNNDLITEVYKVKLYGDLDGNGTINSLDRSYMTKYIAGLEKTEDRIATDISPDGLINATDLAVIKKHAAGLEQIPQNRMYAFVARFNWLNTSLVPYKINGYEEIFDDFSIASNDIDLTFSRYYDSNNTSVGVFGIGFTASFEGSCKTYGDTSKIIKIYGQTPIVFESTDTGYVCNYSRATLTALDNGFVYVGEDGLTYTFNSNGYLTAITDKNSNTVSIEVNTNGKIQKVTDSVGRIYAYSYGDNGYLSSITDCIGRTVHYTYDEYNRLKTVTGVTGAVTEQYEYNSNNKLVKIKDAFGTTLADITYEENSGILASVNDSTGSTTGYTYNANNNSLVITQDNAVVAEYVYNRYNYLTSSNTDYGMQYNYYRNAYGDIIASENSDGEKTWYYYNSSVGYLTSTRTYDAEENVVESSSYDASGNLLTTSSDGEKYTYTYDENGNVLTAVKTVDDVQTESTAYTYDTNGLMLTAQTEDGITSYTYNSYGYVTSETEPDGSVVSRTYDSIGNLLSETADGKTTAYVYNLNGDALKVTENNAVKSRTVYDSYGRIIQQIGEAEYNSAYDGLNLATPVDTYLSNGNEVAVGVRYYYGTDGKLTSIKASCYTVATDNSQKVTSVKAGNTVLAEYNYTDDAKELLSQVDYANGQSISYNYDTDGNITALYYDDTLAYSYTYDTEGTLTYKINHIDGIRTDYTDTSFTVSSIGEDGTLTTLYSHTNEQLSCEEVIPPADEESEEEVIVIDYERITDSFNNQSFATDYYEDYFKYGTFTHTTTFTIDDAVNNVVINNGTSDIYGTAYTYNDDGMPTSLVNTYGGVNDTYSYTYDGNGNIQSVVRNNEQRRYHYDNSGQIIRVDDEIANNTVVYEYNGVSGNIKSVKTYAYTTADTINTTALTTKSFSYTDSNWTDLLTSVDGNALTYDALGNVLTYNGYTYTWEAGRHLTQMTNGTNTYSYKYDDNGIRTEKTVNGVTTYYTTVDGRITGQCDGTNTIYFRYDANNSLIGFNLNGTEYLYIKNIQGDIEGILDQNGNLVVEYTYDAWGKVLTTTGTLANTVGTINPMRYRDYYLDTETGYYYLQSRYYNPELCRFINADEPNMITLNFGNISRVNMFTYCVNDPINSVDPYGYISLKLKAAIIAGIAYGIYNTGKYYGMRMNSLAAWAKLGLAFARGFIKGFSAVYLLGKNKTTLAAMVVGVVSVVIGLIEGTVKSPKKALSVFVDKYSNVTSVAYGKRILSNMRVSTKIREMITWIWDAFF